MKNIEAKTIFWPLFLLYIILSIFTPRINLQFVRTWLRLRHPRSNHQQIKHAGRRGSRIRCTSCGNDNRGHRAEETIRECGNKRLKLNIYNISTGWYILAKFNTTEVCIIPIPPPPTHTHTYTRTHARMHTHTHKHTYMMLNSYLCYGDPSTRRDCILKHDIRRIPSVAISQRTIPNDQLQDKCIERKSTLASDWCW